MGVLTAYGAASVTFMMLMYALERRGPLFVAAFACGCALSSSYGFLAGTWPFGVVEGIWSLIALHRFRALRRAAAARTDDDPAAAGVEDRHVLTLPPRA